MGRFMEIIMTLKRGLNNECDHYEEGSGTTDSADDTCNSVVG
jgi:hypothetical protein